MFKVMYKHKELKDLSWTKAEFIKLVKSGDIRQPEVYALALRVKMFGFKLYINL